MKERHVQFLNAMSMLPGIYFAFIHAFDHDCFFKRMSAYSYIFMCLCSMNYHLYRCIIEHGGNPLLLSQSHMHCLQLDMISQNVCIFFTSFSTVMNHYGSIFIFMISLAYTMLGNIQSHTERLVRHTTNAVVIGVMSSDNTNVMIYFGFGFVCFIVARILKRFDVLHTLFHVLLGFAMNAIWIYDYKHSPNIFLNIPTFFADIIAVASFVIWFHIVVRLHTFGRRHVSTYYAC
jgi:hypothetical protein